MDYKQNKKLLEKCNGETRSLILVNIRLKQIENVLESLNEEDAQAAKIIFIDKYTQGGAEILGLSKAAYYNAMNKIIYLTALEMELI